MDKKISGLSSSAVIEARNKYGSNQLTKQEVESFWDKYKGNFDDPIIKILLVALAINVVFVFLGKAHWYESVGIAVAVLLATLVGTWSEHKNEATFQQLQEDASKIKCKVFRDGNVTEIYIDDIVVGDFILLQSGDKIPADGVIHNGDLKVDQATMNGESAEARKVKPPADYSVDKDDKVVDFLDQHKLFRGTVVCSGEATMVAKSVGDQTQYGKLALEMQTEERESPLKVKLSDLADSISLFGYIGGTLIAVAFIFKKMILENHFKMSEIIAYVSIWQNPVNDIVNAVILAVIIIVVAVPEGLPMMIAMVLSLNMRKMLNDNILVRKLVGIETSGSLNILFSDKTGTITKGQLEVITFISGENRPFNKFDEIMSELRELLHISIAHNTNALFSNEGRVTKIIGGNATERALVGFISMGESATISGSTDNNVEKVFSIPFSSDKKYSATQIRVMGAKALSTYIKSEEQTQDANTLTLIKGAPEKLIGKCTKYYGHNGEIQELTQADIANLEQTMNDLAARAIRVIALATSNEPLEQDTPEETKSFKEMTLVGIVGIRDEVRPEAVSAIKEVQGAGIQVVMITGDRKETAIAIAKESGLIQSDADVILTSEELQTISDDELKKLLPKLRVIARALPTDKSRLVRVAQELNLVVGMTGDGVNDAPALKKSDVGFAMGSGTEVAKEAGDIVILDDNFISIEKAVLYGRTIFKSIRKFVVFQLSINVSAVLISFIGPLIGLVQPLTITQMLWVNLVMDTLAALAFGGEPALRRYMNELPKRRDEKIVSPDMWSAILMGGIFVSGLSIFFLTSGWIADFFRFGPDGKHDMYLYTGFFSFFVFISILNGFNARTETMNLFEHITKNTGFIKVMSSILVIQVIMTYAGGVILRTYGLVFNEWLLILMLALLIIPLDLLRKFIMHSMLKRS